jgi:hypothetical protein
MKRYLLLMIIFLFVGCQTSFNDISHQKGFAKSIGEKFKLKRDVFVVSDNKYKNNLRMPDPQFFPTMKEYKLTGKAKKSFFNSEKIIGIAKSGTIFKIDAIGLVNTGATMGDRGVIKVTDINTGTVYYCHEPGLFYFRSGTLDPHDAYIEMLP